MSRFFDDCSPEDLRLFKHIFQDVDDKEFVYLVYSYELNALTPIDNEKYKHLKSLGIQEIEELPD